MIDSGVIPMSLCMLSIISAGMCECVRVCVCVPGQIDGGDACVIMKQIVMVGCKSGTHRSDVTGRCVVAQLNTIHQEGLHVLH